jgi:hypothetical protein
MAIGVWGPWAIDRDGLLTKAMVDAEGWTHNLSALPDEPNPDANHVHYKFRVRNGQCVSADILCSVKVDGMRLINRRKLIERINATTSLGLSYK